MTNVISIEGRGWFTAAELAEREGVSTRTIYNRLKRGEVEKRDTEAGTRYRLKPDEAKTFSEVHETSTEEAEKPARRKAETDTATVFHERFTESSVDPFTTLIERLEAGAVEQGRLKAERNQLLAELEKWKTFAVEAVEEVERLRDN